ISRIILLDVFVERGDLSGCVSFGQQHSPPTRLTSATVGRRKLLPGETENPEGMRPQSGPVRAFWLNFVIVRSQGSPAELSQEEVATNTSRASLVFSPGQSAYRFHTRRRFRTVSLLPMPRRCVLGSSPTPAGKA